MIEVFYILYHAERIIKLNQNNSDINTWTHLSTGAYTGSINMVPNNQSSYFVTKNMRFLK